MASHDGHDIDTVDLQNGLVGTRFELGEYVTTQELLEQSLATHEKIFGREYANTAQILNGLACV